MESNFSIDIPFETRPPRLKNLVNKYIMGDVWIRDTPFGPVTDSLRIAELFGLRHYNVLRAIDKCRSELGIKLKFELNSNLIDNNGLDIKKKRGRPIRKVDITEFGLALLLLYINSPKAREISAEIIYRFFVLKTYVKGLNENQIGALRAHYKKNISK